jgi:hypothetical protein
MADCRMGRWSPIWRARSASCKVDGRRFRVALLPTEIPASREPGLRLNPQLRRIPAEMRADLTSAEIAMSGSYFDDVLRDPRRYGIENTTDKVRRPGAVRRRRDAVCTERIVGHSETALVDGRIRIEKSTWQRRPKHIRKTPSLRFARHSRSGNHIFGAHRCLQPRRAVTCGYRASTIERYPSGSVIARAFLTSNPSVYAPPCTS